ncbi:hypothetical protein Q5752_001662 [Cryptotrichosporon argae]
MTGLTIVIPTEHVHAPTFGRKLSANDEWFKPPGKDAVALDAPVCPLDPAPPYTYAAAPDSPLSLASSGPDSPRTPSLALDALDTPPLSPCTPTLSPSPLPSAPRKKRPGHGHRRAPSLSDPVAALALFDCPRTPRSRQRARFASVPVTGTITPAWSLDDESDPETELGTPVGTPTAARRLLDPFELLLPYAQTKKQNENVYDLNDDAFLIAPAGSASAFPRHISLRAFRPRVPYVPRHRRPIVTVVACLILFGSLLLTSVVQQAAAAQRTAAIIRQAEAMVDMRAEAEIDSDMYTDVEPGVVPALPAHHALDGPTHDGPARGGPARMADSAAHPVPTGPLVMTAADELAALLSFVVGTSVNVLPAADAAAPLDPTVFLPFDPASPTARAEMDEVAHELWDQYPVFVLGKMRDPKMREVRKLLSGYKVRPEPKYVEIDQRADSTYLTAVLARILGKPDGPYILLQGKLLGASSKLAELEKAKTLVTTFSDAGVGIAKKLKKDKHAREIERVEDERVLGPQAIADDA